MLKLNFQEVPMSVQWSKSPYFYPIQIAQYALEHYSKNLSESPPIIFDFFNNQQDWNRPEGSHFEIDENEKFVWFKTSGKKK